DSRRPAIVLKLRASLRTSGGPLPAADLVFSAPLPSCWAAASSSLSGRLTQRASAIAPAAAAASPASATAASQVHITLTRSSSSSADRDSRTTPRTVWPVSPITGTTTRSRSSAGVSTTVRPRSAAARVAPGTPRSGPPVPATPRPAASYTWTCSPMRRPSASVRVRVPPGGLSSRSSATPPSVSAVSVVSCRNELRSCPAVISPSGTTVVTSSAPIRASMVRTIRRGLKAWPGPWLDLAEPEAPAVGRLDQPRDVELAAQRRHVHVQHFGRAVPVRVPGTLQDLLPRHHPARVAGQAFQDVEFLRGERHLPAPHGHLAGAQVHGERAMPEHLAAWPDPA